MNPDTSYLVSKFDLDPSRVKPMWYEVTIDVPVIINGIGRGSVTMNNQPFLLTRITHAIVGPTYDWATTGWYQDGQYLVAFKDDNIVYQNNPIMSEAFFGANRTGHYLDFRFPIMYAGRRTVSFEVTNTYLRQFTSEADYFPVQLVLHGICDMGTLK